MLSTFNQDVRCPNNVPTTPEFRAIFLPVSGPPTTIKIVDEESIRKHIGVKEVMTVNTTRPSEYVLFANIDQKKGSPNFNTMVMGLTNLNHPLTGPVVFVKTGKSGFENIRADIHPERWLDLVRGW